MKQNKFDLVMDYIDENIQQDTETIKSGIINLIGINSNTFGHYFNVLTGDTLGGYIRNRRLYYAASALQLELEKSICEIALEYGYSEQSAFTRAITSRYGMSPSEFRQKNVIHFIENEKYHFSDFRTPEEETRSDYIWKLVERTGCLSGPNLTFIDDIDKGREEFGFDVDTSYAIADLSERLEVPVYTLMRTCFDLVAELKSEPDYLTNAQFAALQMGIHSDEDLEKICEHYSCKYYELNRYMVVQYYKSHK